MKKAFKISSLCPFSIVMVLLIPILITSNIAFSKSYVSIDQQIPIKRPSNLSNLEESADTILNMIQKVGGKPSINSQSTTLRKNETLSSALKRVNFDSENINKIVDSIIKINLGKRILKSLPVGMIIDYSTPSKLAGGAIKLNYNLSLIHI